MRTHPHKGLLHNDTTIIPLKTNESTTPKARGYQKLLEIKNLGSA